MLVSRQPLPSHIQSASTAECRQQAAVLKALLRQQVCFSTTLKGIRGKGAAQHSAQWFFPDSLASGCTTGLDFAFLFGAPNSF